MDANQENTVFTKSTFFLDFFSFEIQKASKDSKSFSTMFHYVATTKT